MPHASSFFHSFICPGITFFSAYFCAIFAVWFTCLSSVNSYKMVAFIVFPCICTVLFFALCGCSALAYDKVASWVSFFLLLFTLSPLQEGSATMSISSSLLARICVPESRSSKKVILGRTHKEP